MSSLLEPFDEDLSPEEYAPSDEYARVAEHIPAPPRRELSARSVLALAGTAVRRPVLTLAWVVVIIVVLWAVAPGLFTSASATQGDIAQAFQSPGSHHLFGTDELGRDLYARMVYGASHTLSATIYAVGIGFFAGGAIGLIGGYLGGMVDAVIMRFIDALLSIPALLLCMVVVTGLGFGTMNVALAVGIASVASFARVMRADVIRVAQSEFVEASYGLGARRLRVVLLHVLPNSISALLSLAALECGTALLAVAGLGFLGYGAQPPTPDWGLAVSEGRTYLQSYPYIALVPGILIALVVLSTNRISRSLRQGR